MMTLRPETPADYAAVARIHIRAFGGRLGESLIVALSRQQPAYDAELSLVAEVNGEVVGHALFLPYTIRLMSSDARAVNLAPIGVDPAHQGQGIGAALIDEGHRVAGAKGYALSFLLGHVEYYPRFGYKTGVYGQASIDAAALVKESTEESILTARPPEEKDIPALLELWRREERGVDFAVQPGGSLLDWLSPNPGVAAAVYLREGDVVGYTRVHRDAPGSPRMFLAADHSTAREMAALIGAGQMSVTLPLHPYSASAGAFGTPAVRAWDAAMACALLPGALDNYMAQVKNGRRLPGRVIWPSAFDLA